MSSSFDAVSGLQWHEPIEGLEFGELFLGAIASTYFARGFFSGYSFCFTDRRIIGIRMRRAALVVKVPFWAVIIGLYLFVILETLSGAALLVSLLLPLILHFANIPITVLTRTISENIVSRRASDVSKLMRQGRDFELRRNEIEELLMKIPGKRSFLKDWSTGGGYLKITMKDNRVRPVEIRIRGLKEHEKLRNLVINFSSREPKVRAMEYPHDL